MPVVYEIINNIESSIAALKTAGDRAAAEHRDLESVISECYHMLEFLNLSGVELVLVANRLKTALKQRRLVKEEGILVQNMLRDPLKITPTTINKEKINSDNRIKEYDRLSRIAYSKMFKKPYAADKQKLIPVDQL